MRRLSVVSVALSMLAFAGCQRTDERKPPIRTVTTGSGGSGAAGSGAQPNQRPKTEQLTPPLELAHPPLDAVKTSTGLVYKKLTTVEGTPAPKRNDTVMIKYTGWRASNGETFYSNMSKDQPMPLALPNTAPGFTEALQLLHKGERAMLWLPPEIGYKGTPPAGTKPETLVYEVEVTDVLAAPDVPADVGTAPASAQKLASGLPYVVVKSGTGKDKVRTFDTVTFNYTAWDHEGRMFDSTEMRKRPATVPPFRQVPAMEEILTAMTAGERLRVWLPSDAMKQGGRPLAGLPEGTLTYEIEVIQIEKGNPPPPTPRDVAAPPADAQKTPKGVAYKILKTGKGGPKPKVTDTVKVNYTGWTTAGRMFDSSVIKGPPAEFSLGGVMTGWTEALPVLSVGDHARFWIPDELAYKGAPGRPQGMLVFDIELVSITAAPEPAAKATPPASDLGKPAPIQVK